MKLRVTVKDIDGVYKPVESIYIKGIKNQGSFLGLIDDIAATLTASGVEKKRSVHK